MAVAPLCVLLTHNKIHQKFNELMENLINFNLTGKKCKFKYPYYCHLCSTFFTLISAAFQSISLQKLSTGLRSGLRSGQDFTRTL